MGLRRKRARRARAPALPPPQAAERARSKPAAGRKRGSGSLLRRLVYWSLVLGVWAVIAAAGVIAFAVSTLPPIQTLSTFPCSSCPCVGVSR